jgi:hypothetical protein
MTFKILQENSVTKGASMKRKAAFKSPKLEILPAHLCKGIHGVAKNKISISGPNILVNIAQLTN